MRLRVKNWKKKERSPSLNLTNEIFKYLAEQTSGVVIALVLIIRIEGKLDSLVASINRLTQSVNGENATVEKNLPSEK